LKIVIIFSVSLLSLIAYGMDVKADNQIIPSDTIESGYGPVSCPNIDISTMELETRLRQLDSAGHNSDFLYELGYLAFQLDSFDLAEKYFHKSEEVDNFATPYYPTFINYWYGQIYESKGLLEKAKEHYTALNDPYYLHLIQAMIYENSGKIDSARTEYLKASEVQLFETVPCRPFWELTQMFLKAGSCSEAEYYSNKYIECSNDKDDFGVFSADYIASDEELGKIRNAIDKCK